MNNEWGTGGKEREAGNDGTDARRFQDCFADVRLSSTNMGTRLFVTEPIVDLGGGKKDRGKRGKKRASAGKGGAMRGEQEVKRSPSGIEGEKSRARTDY